MSSWVEKGGPRIPIIDASLIYMLVRENGFIGFIGKDVSFTDIEVVKKSSGEPDIRLLGNAKKFAEKHQIALIKISLTHAEHYAAANAVAMQLEDHSD